MLQGYSQLAVAGIGAVAAVTASFFTAQATASNRVNEIDAQVRVVTEREENHYQEVKGSLDRIEKKIDQLK